MQAAPLAWGCDVRAHYLNRKPYGIIIAEVFIMAAVQLCVLYLTLSAAKRATHDDAEAPAPIRSGARRHSRQNERQKTPRTSRHPGTRAAAPAKPKGRNFFLARGGRHVQPAVDGTADHSDEHATAPTSAADSCNSYTYVSDDEQSTASGLDEQVEETPRPDCCTRTLSAHVIELVSVALKAASLVLLLLEYRAEMRKPGMSLCSRWTQYQVGFVYLLQTNFLADAYYVYLLSKAPYGVMCRQPVHVTVSFLASGVTLLLGCFYIVTHIVPGALIFFPIILVCLMLLGCFRGYARGCLTEHLNRWRARTAQQRVAAAEVHVDSELAFHRTMARLISLILTTVLGGLVLQFYAGVHWTDCLSRDYENRSVRAYFSRLAAGLYSAAQALD